MLMYTNKKTYEIDRCSFLANLQLFIATMMLIFLTVIPFNVGASNGESSHKATEPALNLVAVQAVNNQSTHTPTPHSDTPSTPTHKVESQSASGNIQDYSVVTLAEWGQLIAVLFVTALLGWLIHAKGNEIKLSTKIAGVLGISIAAIIGLSTYSTTSMNAIGKSLLEIAEEDIPLTNAITEIAINQVEQALWAERAITGAYANDAKAREHAEHEFEQLAHLVDEELKAAEAMAKHGIDFAHNEQAKQKFNEVFEHLLDIEAKHDSYDNHVVQLYDLLNQGKVGNHETHELILSIEKEGDKLDHELKQFMQSVEAFTLDSARNAEHQEQSALKMQIGLSLVVTILVILLGCIITYSVSKRLKGIIEVAHVIAGGNLTQSVDSSGKDEIADVCSALGEMQEKMTTVIRDINRNSTEIASASSQVSATAETLSQGASEQAASVEETSASIEEMGFIH